MSYESIKKNVPSEPKTAKAAQVRPVLTERAAASQTAAADTASKAKPVLIAEDSRESYEILHILLNDINVPGENAADGAAAVSACREKSRDYYSLILTDLNLPLLSGFEAAAEIRRLGIKIPIIAVTAADKNGASATKALLMFDDVLFKPFNHVKFYDVLSPYIQNAADFFKEHESIPAKSLSDSALYPLPEDICDLNTGISNMGSDPELFIKHLNSFGKNNSNLACRLESMLGSQSYKEAAELCHSAKGTAGMLALSAVYSDLGRLGEILGEICPEYTAANSGDRLTDRPVQTPHLSAFAEKTAYRLTADIADDMRAVCRELSF